MYRSSRIAVIVAVQSGGVGIGHASKTQRMQLPALAVFQVAREGGKVRLGLGRRGV